jgi:hypothetical protein
MEGARADGSVCFVWAGCRVGRPAAAPRQVAPEAGRAQFAGWNRAVKWRSCLGWETIRMPGRSQAR